MRSRSAYWLGDPPAASSDRLPRQLARSRKNSVLRLIVENGGLPRNCTPSPASAAISPRSIIRFQCFLSSNGYFCTRHSEQLSTYRLASEGKKRSSVWK